MKEPAYPVLLPYACYQAAHEANYRTQEALSKPRFSVLNVSARLQFGSRRKSLFQCSSEALMAYCFVFVMDLDFPSIPDLAKAT